MSKSSINGEVEIKVVGKDGKVKYHKIEKNLEASAPVISAHYGGGIADVNYKRVLGLGAYDSNGNAIENEDGTKFENHSYDSQNDTTIYTVDSKSSGIDGTNSYAYFSVQKTYTYDNSSAHAYVHSEKLYTASYNSGTSTWTITVFSIHTESSDIELVDGDKLVIKWTIKYS